MDDINAIVFVPHGAARPGREASVMYEKLLFVPLGKWLSQALSAAGVGQFFVVFAGEDGGEAKGLFPENTQFVDKRTDSPEVELHGFLSRQAAGSRTIVVTRPVFLSDAHISELIDAPSRTAERPIFRFQEDKRMSESGVFTVSTELLMEELRSGRGFDLVRALLEVGDPICESAPVIEDAKALSRAVAPARRQVADRLIAGGATLTDPDALWISPDAQVGCGTVLHPGCVVEPGCVIGEGCVIGPHVHLKDARVEAGAELSFCQAEGCAAGGRPAPFGKILPPAPEPEPLPEPESPKKRRLFGKNR